MSPQSGEVLETIPVFLANFMQKGGVGKTETARELAAALAELGYRVIAVDLDPPGHFTNGIYTGHETLTSLYHLDTEQTLFRALIPEAFPSRNKPKKMISYQDLIVKPPHEKFDLIPAHDEMLQLEDWLKTVPNGYDRIKEFLNQIVGYDFVVIDSPPNMGPISDGILNAVRDTDNIGTRQQSVSQPGDAGLVVPMLPDSESINALDQLLDQIESVEQQFRIHITILTLVMNQYLETQFSKSIMEKLHVNVPSMPPFVVRKRDVVRNAYDAGQSIFTYWPEGTQDQYQRKAILELRAWYRDLATLLVDKVKALKGGLV